MLLNDYYKFERVATKAKHRLDCTASTKSYKPFEDKRAIKETKASVKRDAISINNLIIYLGFIPLKFKTRARGNASLCLTLAGKNLSSIFIPQINGFVGYGDINNTSDAILVLLKNVQLINGAVCKDAKIEIFVSRGNSRSKELLYNVFLNGNLLEEIKQLRAKATSDKE